MYAHRLFPPKSLNNYVETRQVGDQRISRIILRQIFLRNDLVSKETVARRNRKLL